MALIREADLAVVRDDKGRITAIRYLLSSPLFAPSLSRVGTSCQELDAVIIEENAPFWHGQCLSLNIDGDEVTIKLRMDERVANAVNASGQTLMQEIATFIRAAGRVEVVEHIVDPAKVINQFAGWEPRTVPVLVRYYATYFDFLNEFGSVRTG
ncbi:hypothetical protein BTO32_14730 [Marinobacter lutaoensis]|uniref:Uncharacterized protein n=1 Tax=Marinobacter lutaoensis TaxID=135739 RepID=A0A1V2DPY4_9GAMM|nr:hypothetical protein [Marinobacter lutaoensis]ONF42466.1 hypothetical protein BTO32_14730 [Marinobacter lutaoensis]